MDEPPRIMAPLPRNQRNIDIDHLNLLSIFHFVAAGLAVFGMLFLMAHFAFMHFIFSNPALWQNQKQQPPPELIFAVFKVFYVLGGGVLVAMLILNLLSGLFLRERRHRTFSLVVAAINCLQVPLGTVLGVFTIVVLVKDSVRELYEETGRHG